MRRRTRTYYPKKAKGPAPSPRVPQLPAVASIDPTAGRGRAGMVVGTRVTILGSGLYAGERAVIERLAGGVIPAALVRTEAGRTRQVRTIDLELAADDPAEARAQ
jgi:hypothetical protein